MKKGVVIKHEDKKLNMHNLTFSSIEELKEDSFLKIYQIKGNKKSMKNYRIVDYQFIKIHYLHGS